MAPTRNYPMCKNSRRYNRTRNFGLYGHAESKKTQKFVFRSALRPNQILFSHDQDPFETCPMSYGRTTAIGHASGSCDETR
jgi:hypothetical protein